ncbi:MAG: hypothetical protein IKC06_08615 [Clostridia bacterium]|nr:hypothetical protein [Clostridia bacterium]
MNAEKLHDALNYLDDSMILETDKLRHRKKKTVIFRRFVSCAACICLIATAVFGIGHMRSIRENTPFDENFEVSKDKADTPPTPDNSDPSQDPAPPAEESESADESVPAQDQEKDEVSESIEESAPADERLPEEESAPADEWMPDEDFPPVDQVPPAEETPPEEDEEKDEEKTYKLVIKVVQITTDGFKGYVRNKNDIYDINEYVTVINEEREKPIKGDTVDVYFSEYDGYTVYAERIFIVKE